MGDLYRVLFTVFALVVISPQNGCNPLFFPSYIPRPALPTSASESTSSAATPVQSSNVSIALGNRVNTNTTLDDYGTRIDGLTVNVVRRRRRRDIWSIPSSLGSDIQNGSYIAINNQIFPLPDNLSNVSLNVGSLSNSQQILNTSQSSFMPTIPENYTNAFQKLVTQFETLPLNFMDNIVQLLSTGYQNTFGRLFIEQSFERLNQTLEHGRTAVRNGLNNLVNQTGQGFEQIIARFNDSSTAVQRCIGNNLNPTNVASSVVDKGYNCVNRKWQELNQLAGNIGEDIVAADKGASEFLANLTTCNGANFNGTDNSSKLRRQCYVRTIVSFPRPLLFLPVSLAIDSTKLYASVSGLETEIGACAAEVALEIGMTTAQIGTKIVLCQIFS